MALFMQEGASGSASDLTTTTLNIFSEDLEGASNPFLVPPTYSRQHSHSKYDDDDDVEPDVAPLCLPSGTWTLLPAIEACDNAVVPRGPFNVNRRAGERQSKKRSSPSSCSSSRLPSPSEAQSRLGRKATDRQALNEHGDQLRADNDGDDVPDIPMFVKRRDVQPIGFLRRRIVRQLQIDNDFTTSKLKMQPCWTLLRSSASSSSLPASSSAPKQLSSSAENDKSGMVSEIPSPPRASSSGAKSSSSSSLPGEDIDDNVEDDICGVCFSDWINESDDAKDLRAEHIDRVVRAWKHQGLFLEELGGWRNEQYPIYGPPLPQDDPNFTPLPGGNVAFTLERAACSLFGFTTFGVHLTAYVVVVVVVVSPQSSDKGDGQEQTRQRYRIWVPRRSKTKQTWPGYLDNSVAGGITAGDSPLETVVRECGALLSSNPLYSTAHRRMVVFSFRVTLLGQCAPINRKA